MELYSDRALLAAETTLRQQQGVSPDDLHPIIAGILAEPATIPHAEKYWGELAQLPSKSDWGYDEPSQLDEIVAALPASLPLPDFTGDLYDRIHGGLLGRFAGMMLGKPLEGLVTAKTIRRYLQLADAYPLEDYIPLLDPFPAEIQPPAWSRWHDTTRGNIAGVVQDDDVEFTIAAAAIVGEHGLNFTPADVGRFWLANFAYERLFTAERVAYKNLINGVPASAAADFRNPYREWIGAQIRADVYGYLCPGQPRRAANLAYRDAALSHRGNGIYGAMWVAGMIAAAFVLTDPLEIVQAGLAEIPPRSRLAEAIGDVITWSERHENWEQTSAAIAGKYGHVYQANEGVNWVHLIPNACLVAMGLLHSRGEFSAAICSGVMGGWDTDCNSATIGSIYGIMLGAANLPAKWSKPLNDQVESYIPGYNNVKITALARHINQLAKLLPANNSDHRQNKS